MRDFEATVRDYAAVKRRIGNMEIMLSEKMAKRDRLMQDPKRRHELAETEHRIGNAEILLAEKRGRHDALKALIDAEVARTEVRLGFIDFDARNEPKTGRWCIRCQRDLAPEVEAGRVRLVHVGGAPHAIAIDDVPRYEAGRLALPPAAEDAGWHPIGPECFRRQGAEWVDFTRQA